MNRFRPLFRLDKTANRSSILPANRQTDRSLKPILLSAIRAMAPTLLALSFAGVAHAQGTMDFSGAQTLMGTFKTTVLDSIREGAEKSGYTVEGFAPTSRASAQLREAGIDANTLQSFLARGEKHPSVNPELRHLYMLDESSLASTRQMRAFLDKLNPNDRVLVIGDTSQHQGVDAGKPFEQMQDAGMRTSQLDRIMRQKDPELLKAVEHLARNNTQQGIDMLASQGRVIEIHDKQERIAAIARDYAALPADTIIVSPDNLSRQQINEAVRAELLQNGMLAENGQRFRTLTHRSDMTGADRTWAARYNAGDVLQYTAGSKTEGIERNSFATVRSVDARANMLTVEITDGSSVTYDPRRLRGVNVFREVDRVFATGDRIQFTSSSKELGVANRDLGSITGIEDGKLSVQMDTRDGNEVSYNPAIMKNQTGQSTVYREEQRAMAVGERIQFTHSDRDAHIRFGDLATVEQIGENNTLSARLDTGKSVELDTDQARHIDYGYAVANAQRGSADRVLVTGEASELAQQQEALMRLSPHIRDLAIYTSDSRDLAVQQAIPGVEIALQQSAISPTIESIQTPSAPQIELEGFGIGL